MDIPMRCSISNRWVPIGDDFRTRNVGGGRSLTVSEAAENLEGGFSYFSHDVPWVFGTQLYLMMMNYDDVFFVMGHNYTEGIKKETNVVKTIVNHHFFDANTHYMVILGMVYYCFNHVFFWGRGYFLKQIQVVTLGQL